LAEREHTAPRWLAMPAILDEADAALFRLAHRARNGVYHEDRHNSALLIPLTWLYLAAVGRAFCRQYEAGAAVGGGIESRVIELERFGYRLPEDGMRRGMFEFRVAAETVMQTLMAPLHVELVPLADLLISDLRIRTSDAAAVVLRLLEDDMPFEDLTFSIYWSQFWNACGADERAQELEELREQASEELMRETDSQARRALQAAYEQANDEYIARWHELQRTFKPLANLDTMVTLGKLGPKLCSATTIRNLLERYERLDIELQAFESSVGSAASGWSTRVEMAVDAALERENL
jgi:hypothetical protein